MVVLELILHGNEPLHISYVVIAARYDGGWLFVKHRRRGGYELPAGHPDLQEDTVMAAARELKEETGAYDFIMEPVAYYSVGNGQDKQYGRLFYAEVEALGKIEDTAEIESVHIFRRMPSDLSLREVMTFLYRLAVKHVRYNQY